jgi:hypothetical protein
MPVLIKPRNFMPTNISEFAVGDVGKYQVYCHLWPKKNKKKQNHTYTSRWLKENNQEIITMFKHAKNKQALF